MALTNDIKQRYTTVVTSPTVTDNYDLIKMVQLHGPTESINTSNITCAQCNMFSWPCITFTLLESYVKDTNDREYAPDCNCTPDNIDVNCYYFRRDNGMK